MNECDLEFFEKYADVLSKISDKKGDMYCETNHDIIIEYDSQIIVMIVEVKDINKLPVELIRRKDIFFKEYGLFFAITDNNEWFYYRPKGKRENTTLHDFVKIVNDTKSFILSSEIQEKIKLYIKNKIRRDNKINLTTFQKKVFRSFIDKIQFKVNDFYMSIKNQSQDHSFFRHLCGDTRKKYNSMLRFTSLDSLMNILKKQEVSMMGLTAMNDSEEANKFGDLSYPINNYYIVSGTKTSHVDDLTMWRLYGQNAKGVCLEFDCNENAFNYYFGKVYYSESMKIYIIKFVAEIQRYIYNEFMILVKFKFMDYMAFFFKSEDYKIEDEYRLLYIESPNVVKNFTMPYSKPLLSVVRQFKIDNDCSPLRLKKIIVGSNCPYADDNVLQLKNFLLNRKNDCYVQEQEHYIKYFNIEVEKSTIKNYCS